ncbi:hypothetical protein ACJJTC_009752 [Scirpophaga incertulas]
MKAKAALQRPAGVTTDVRSPSITLLTQTSPQYKSNGSKAGNKCLGHMMVSDHHSLRRLQHEVVLSEDWRRSPKHHPTAFNVIYRQTSRLPSCNRYPKLNYSTPKNFLHKTNFSRQSNLKFLKNVTEVQVEGIKPICNGLVQYNPSFIQIDIYDNVRSFSSEKLQGLTSEASEARALKVEKYLFRSFLHEIYLMLYL